MSTHWVDKLKLCLMIFLHIRHDALLLLRIRIFVIVLCLLSWISRQDIKVGVLKQVNLTTDILLLPHSRMHPKGMPKGNVSQNVLL